MNRDYFTKPIQGSRSAHDYGRTTLHDDRLVDRASVVETLLTCLIIFAVTMFVVYRLCV